MIHRKPRKGDKLTKSKNWTGDTVTRIPLGVVTHVEGNICHYERSDGSTDMFIWWFESDKLFNQNVGIQCRGCSDDLRGHEDESRNYCRFCVTCHPRTDEATETEAAINE